MNKMVEYVLFKFPEFKEVDANALRAMVDDVYEQGYEHGRSDGFSDGYDDCLDEHGWDD